MSATMDPGMPSAAMADPRLFVVGASGTGKTPLARQVADALGVPHIMASEWVRRVFPEGDTTDRVAKIEAMTRFSLEALKRDPWACTAYLQRHHALERPCVIEGMRNPGDFVRTFDPRSDLAVFLTFRSSPLPRTSFEGGIPIIRAYVGWLCQVGLLPADRVLDEAYDDMSELDGAIARALQLARAHFPDEPVPGGRMARVHADLPPLQMHVREELLYGGDPSKVGSLVPCTVFSVASYPGSVPTFQILLEDGAVFSYIPPSGLLSLPHRPDPELSLADLVYHNCPDGDFVLTVHQALSGPVSCYFKHRDLWMDGTYRFTLDWYRGNDLLHCLALDNGQLALLPNHKVKFGSGHAPGFRPYKKMRLDWRV